MPLILPTSLDSTRNISGVAPQLLAALRDGSADLPSVRSVVLVVVDGLGALPLRAHAGHARTLSSAMAKKDVAGSVFPTTTAAALTSLLTGSAPGGHGLVGYRVRDSESDTLVNLLSGWDEDGIDPLRWQESATVFEQAAAAEHPAFAIGIPAYEGSGFSRATLRGAAPAPGSKRTVSSLMPRGAAVSDAGARDPTTGPPAAITRSIQSRIPSTRANTE